MRTRWIFYSHSALFLVFLIASAFEPAWAQKHNSIPIVTNDESVGPETGGGGNIVLANGQLVLLDFFNFPDVSQISRLIEKKQASLLASVLPFSLTENSSGKLQPLNPSPANFIFFSEVLLSQWGISTIRYSNTITPQMHAQNPKLQRMNWSVVDRLETDSKYYSPRFLPSSFQIEKAAYYNAAEKEVKISGFIWSQLNFSSRLGLIIHEKFRQIQLTFGYMMDDQLLQKATVMAMVCKPEPARLHLILNPSSILFGQYRNLNLHNEQIHQFNLMMDQYLNECLSAEGLSYQP